MTHPAAPLFERAKIARDQRRFADERDCLLQAVSECRRAAPPHWPLGMALRRLGEAERALKNLDAARKSYVEAVAAMRQDAEPQLLAHTLRHLGDVCREIGALEAAGAGYEEAIAIYRGHREAPALDYANALRAFALYLDAKGENDRAAECWRQARDLYDSLGLWKGAVGCSLRLALIAKSKGNETLRRQELGVAESEAQKSGDPDLRRSVADAAGQG